MNGGVGGQGMVHDEGAGGFLEVNAGHGGGGLQRWIGPLTVMAGLEVVRLKVAAAYVPLKKKKKRKTETHYDFAYKKL